MLTQACLSRRQKGMVSSIAALYIYLYLHVASFRGTMDVLVGVESCCLYVCVCDVVSRGVCAIIFPDVLVWRAPRDYISPKHEKRPRGRIPLLVRNSTTSQSRGSHRALYSYWHIHSSSVIEATQLQRYATQQTGDYAFLRTQYLPAGKTCC